MNKTILPILLLAISCQAEPQPCKCPVVVCDHFAETVKRWEANGYPNGNRLKVIFESTVTTNKYSASEWQRRKRGDTHYWMTNGILFNYLFNHTCPTYPLTNTYVDHFEVVSNTVALFILDGQTNRVATATNVIDTYKQTVQVVVSTVTNTSTTIER